MRTKTVKRALSLILALAVTAICSISAMAADTTVTGTGSVTGNVTVNGSITALTISVTHPLAVDYAINPNTGTAGTFTAPDISIKNLTKCPVNITVFSLKAAAGGTVTLTDVDVADKTWASLNAADSKKYIALGIKAKDANGWATGYSTATHYATKDTASLIGALPTNTTGTMTLVANFGLAFDAAYTAKHSLVLMFNLV
ncbi:MAG: hypothetical protein PHD46_05605 [Eubacteriales bacterium]|nr:hypothetical protein [Eubacteriales bacterium]MDD4422494.1 hypothetical protein [Eubacteriales bacterium]